jgi:hypothetical protein
MGPHGRFGARLLFRFSPNFFAFQLVTVPMGPPVTSHFDLCAHAT